MPCSPSTFWILWVKDAYKPLNMKKIFGSPQKLPKDFKEWLPSFLGDYFFTTKDHLYTFLCSLEPYDQHEDVQMRLFSYTLVGRAKEWYDSIFQGQSQVGIFFREHFPKYSRKTKIVIPFMINSITTKENHRKT
jgi:hypothetical protein